MRTAVELGPKGKKQVAYAIDWPGLERNGKTVESAIANMEAYRPRYQKVVDRARMGEMFASESPAEVVLEYTGTGSTDFWGISFGQSEIDKQPLSNDDLERQLALLAACWDEFDAIAARVSPELKKGPRGGGRDRDHIIRHVLFNEADWAKGIGVNAEQESLLDPAGRQAYRQDYAAAIREHHAARKMAKTWTLPFLIRHSAYHTLDHAWEMEDKDLTGADA